MIKRVEIEDFKCLHQENLEFKPLTIITGLNSTGKSSLIQAILLPFIITSRFVNDIINPSFEAIRNKYQNAKEVKFSLFFEDTALEFNQKEDESPWTRYTGIDDGANFPFDIEKNIFYLSANRIGMELYSSIHPEYKVGTRGHFLLGTFEKEKSTPIITGLIKDKTSYTLSTQVNYWLSYILDISTELQSEKRLENQVEAKYNSDGLQNISPLQLGAGVGYLTKILIMCLRAKKGDILIVENPEIHLHPAAQAKMGEFLAFVAKAGIQVIVETHCEHLILKIGYEIYKKRYSNENVTILYKGGIQKPFEVIDYKDNGKFKTDFPDGFFDATLAELLEME